MSYKKGRKSEIRIRRATPTDLESIYKIEQQAFHDAYSRAFINYLYHISSNVFLVAEKRTAVVGYVIASIDHDLGHIISIAIHSLERRKMIGRRIMGKALEILKTLGVITVRLEVRRSNTEAQRFYEEIGFQRSHSIAQYYGDEDALVYSKQLV